MMKWLRLLAAGLLGLCLGGRAGAVSPQEPTVHAVLFFSPTCPHCQLVIEGTILPLMDQYGDRLEIAAMSTLTPEGQELYRVMVERFAVPSERLGVPTLVVGETVLVGSVEIPGQFPAIIEAGLVQGGIDWPNIPGLAELLAASGQPQEPPTPDPTAEPPLTGATPRIEPEPDLPVDAPLPVWQANWLRDPLGNSLAVFVLVGMLASTAAVGFQFTQGAARGPARAGWSVPMLSTVGLLIAGYLAFVETSGSLAVCGPVGDCNTVQQSEYAVLFGVLPVGVLGVLGYLAMLATWAVGRWGHGKLADAAWLGLFAQAAFGVLFSIYLTTLEPFVIGATCLWCLSSAVILTVLMWLASTQAAGAWAKVRGRAGV